jgi:SAM-dependent methyltransferase
MSRRDPHTGAPRRLAGCASRGRWWDELAATARLWVVAAASLAFASQLIAQATGTHPISGRRYAPVMGYQGAAWLERPERLEEEEPDRAIAVMKIAKGSSVADIGAGSGYITVKLADRVGPAGRVFATDLQPQMLEILRRRLADQRIQNVTLVQGAIDDPNLPPASVDLELMVDVYHELSQPQAMLRGLREALKPNGRLVLLEYRKEDRTIPIRLEHKMSVAEAKLEVEHEGFTLAEVDESLPWQHILIFTKRDTAP